MMTRSPKSEVRSPKSENRIKGLSAYWHFPPPPRGLCVHVPHNGRIPKAQWIYWRSFLKGIRLQDRSLRCRGAGFGFRRCFGLRTSDFGLSPHVC